MRAISSPARTTLSRVAYRWFTATSGDGGSRSAPGCARTAESTSPTVESRGSSMSSDDAPSASAYEAKRRRVTVMGASASYTSTDAEGSTTSTKPRQVPGLKRSAEKRLRFRHLLGVVLELFDRDVRHHRAELLRGLEDRHRTRRHLYWRSSARIARHPCLAVANLERAEAAHLDVLLFLERFLDRVEEGIDDSGTILLRDHGPGRAGYLGGHTLDQIGFRHGWASERAAEGC